jgi:hypothetical protein
MAESAVTLPFLFKVIIGKNLNLYNYQNMFWG